MLKSILIERNISKVSIFENFKSPSKFYVLKQKKKPLALDFYILFLVLVVISFILQRSILTKKIVTKELLSNHKEYFVDTKFGRIYH